MFADVEEVEMMDVSEIYAKRLNAKRKWFFPKKLDIFPVADGRIKLLGGDQDLRTSNSRRKSRRFSWRIRRVSSITSWLISGCRWSDEWFLVHVRKPYVSPSRWIQSQTLLAKKRIIPYSTEIHWRLQKYSYELGCCARTSRRWLLEYRWVKRFVWFLDRFHTQFTHWKRNLQTERGERLTRKQLTSRQIIYGQNSGRKWERISSWRRGNSGHMKKTSPQQRTKIARDPFHWPCGQEIQGDHQECSQDIGNANGSRYALQDKQEQSTCTEPWKIQWDHIKTCVYFGRQWIQKTACGRIFTESSWGPYFRKGGQFTATLQFIRTQYFPTTQSHEYSRSKGSSGQGMGKIGKIRRGTWRKSEVRKRWSMKQGRMGAKVHFASLMDTCHLKNAELEAKHQKIQGSSCTPRWYCKRRFWISCSIHWTRIISITNDSSKIHGSSPDCRVAQDKQLTQYLLVPRYKWRMYPNYWKLPKSECPGIRLPRHKWSKSWSSMEDPVVPLERNQYGHPLAGLLWERQFEKILLQHGWEKVSNWECFFVHREKGLFKSVYVDDIKLAGKKQNSDPMWKVLNKEVDLWKPTSFFDHENLGRIQRHCEISKDIVDNHRAKFESRVSAGWTEKLPYSENIRISSWSCDVEGHAKKCVERHCESANKTTQQLYKVSTPCIDDHHFKEEELKSVGLSKIFS